MTRNLPLKTVLMLAVALAPLGFSAALAQDGAAPADANVVALPEVDVISTSPLAGAGGEDRFSFPSQVQTVDAPAFERTRSPSVTDTLQQRVPGVTVTDINGNPFSQDLMYRGFEASPLQGTPQGLAVYQNGMRVNEAFGDTVNWDLIPPQAIARTDIFTANPIFGLNALGGAVSIEMKNGFNWQGFEAQILGGSYGRVSGYFQYGKQVDNFSLYVTADVAHEGGWRYFSPSTLVRAYGDLGYRTQDAEVHFIASGATSNLGVIGPTPVNLLSQSLSSVFTFPQTTQNDMGSIALTGKFDINKNWQIASNFYMRTFRQKHSDGNDADLGACDDPNDGLLCLDEDNFPAVTNPNAFVVRNNHTGQAIPYTDGVVYGTIDRTETHSTTAGVTLQATDNEKLFDHANYFTFGGSVDRGFFNFASTSTLGAIQANLNVVPTGTFAGSNAILQTAGDIGYVPTYLNGTTTYYGIYALDTFNITPEFAATAGARLNIANINTEDASGLNSELTSASNFNRINPVFGLTYKILPWLSAYGGYSEANRAPTPLELDCANPQKPCLLENSLVSDPPLQQVVSHTIEAGLRGTANNVLGGQINWKAGYFHTESTNDIISLASTITGRGYYANVPATLRQGVEASIEYHSGNLMAYANYALVDATYRFTAELASPNNPYADANGNVLVTPGDHIPGIPRQTGKFGLEYSFTSQFKAGADILIVGSQYYVGDNSNLNPQLPLYWTANIHASYQVTENIQVFGLVNNLFNNRNATYGAFFDTTTNAQIANGTSLTDPRTLTPLAPISVYAGVKVNF
ncbi:TonB-dependent receptor [Methylocella silvestris]|uniref:TonB-dependent receptor n=2 Tax=Methylocella silvestris TaxID=199596 RepID=A0A2J7TJC1_METSI|nr:TonB-dependent receptor [Methylocella silvestris]